MVGRRISDAGPEVDAANAVVVRVIKALPIHDDDASGAAALILKRTGSNRASRVSNSSFRHSTASLPLQLGPSARRTGPPGKDFFLRVGQDATPAPYRQEAPVFDHVKFGVSDFAASKAFFLRALAPLGVAVDGEGPPTYGIEMSRDRDRP